VGNLRKIINYRVSYVVIHSRGQYRGIQLAGNFVLVLEAEKRRGEKRNKILRMYNIPPEIALELEKLSNSDHSEIETVSEDFRYTFVDTLLEMPSIEKILQDSVSEIVIDRLHTDSNVYSAKVVIRNTYSGIPKEIRMIPSHAVLLSVIGNIPLYVNEDLLIEVDEDGDREGYIDYDEIDDEELEEYFSDLDYPDFDEDEDEEFY